MQNICPVWMPRRSEDLV